MAPRKMVAIVYAFVALALCPVIFSAPAPKQTCAPVCNERRQSVLKYEEGKTYMYNFETEVVTQLVGSTDENSRIKVKGLAAVAAQSTCDLTLTIQQIAITSSSSQAITRVGDIEGSSIRFALNDGAIDSVCVSEDDPTWSANIKRAIVSMLGNRALNGDTETIETDVNGKCRTTYQVSGSKYTKTKDLQSCTNRDGGMANVFGVPYTAPSKYHSVPLFDSTLTCVQELSKGLIQNVECTEVHNLSVVQTSGVRTDVRSTLSLANVESGLIKGRDSGKRSSLLFDFGEVTDVQRQKTSASNAVDLLNKVCKEIESGTVSLKVPGLFLQLRKAVKYVRKDDLKLMHQQITSGKLCQESAKAQLGKLYLDAVGMSAGDGPISFLAEVIASGQAEESTKDIFAAYAIFANQPGPLALEAMEALVSRSDAEADNLLTASGLAHQYCRMTNPDCGSNDQYHSLVDKIAQHVRTATDEESIEKVIVALQSLGNLDSLTPAAVSAVVNLIEDSSTNQRLKVRALDAFRRDPCQDTLKKKAFKIFSDNKESSQVRIQAYLTVSKCLTPHDIPVVQAVVDNDDESNQVGSFVVSHVYNVLESSSPGKLAQKKVFELIKLREFPSDIRKFSRNFEISAFDSSLMNSGLSVDSNVIFSQDSYIPRCSNANFTVDAFGRSYNLMEFGLCIEDFEHIVERFLGPAGALRSVSLDDIVREGADKLNKIKSSISGRFKRDVAVQVDQNEIEAIRNEVDISERTGDNGNGDIYVRVLGTSIAVESFSRNGIKNQPLGTRILRGLEKLAEGVREQNVDITEPFMFMDDEVILPTSSGLPLTVQIQGTSVLSLQMQGNLDVASLLRGNNGDMRAKIMPSAATVIKAKMTLGTGPIESGLQIEGKIHSAAGVDLKVVREDGKFELRVNVPQDRVQVFDIRSDIYWVEQSMDQLEKKTPMKTKLASKSLIDNECTSKFTRVLGLKVCADVKVPQASSDAPLFFLNGPSVASLYVEKIEPSMEGYYVKIESVKAQDTYGLDFIVDTPGSRTNRKVTAKARAIGPASATPQYSLKIESPLNNVELNYKRSFTDELKGVELKVAIDGDAYSGTAELRKSADGAGHKLIPLVQYQLPQGKPVKLLEGEITRVPGKQLDVNIKTGGPFRSARGSVKGSLTINKNEPDSVDVTYKDVEFASEVAGKILLDGFYKRQGKLVDLRLNSKYGQTGQHTLTVDATGGSPAPRENVLKIVARSSRREILNFDLDWKLKRGDNKLEHYLDYTRGLAEPKVVIHQKSEIEIVSRKEFDVESEITIKHPTYGIDFKAEAEAKSVPGQERHAEFELKAGDNLKAEASYKASGDGLSDYKVLANLVLGDKKYEVSEVATKVDSHKKKYKSRLSVEPGFYYEADTDVYIKYEKSEFKSDLSTVVKSDLFEHPVTLKALVAGKKEGYGALLKLDAQGKNFLDLQTNHKIQQASGSPTSYTTKMKAHVYNLIDAKLSNTYSNGNGDLVLDALLIKSGRKIAATSKVQRTGETYDLKADLKWDAERDPSQAATLKSLTTLSLSEFRLDSKNDITVVDKTAQFNARSTLARDILNGENTAEVDYVSPSGKAYSVASKLDLENKRKVRAAKLKLKLVLPETKPSDYEFNVRASNIDEEDRTFELKTDIIANYRGEKDLAIHGEATSALPGNYRSFSGSISATGSAIPKPVAVSVKTDVKNGKLVVKAEGSKGPQAPVIASLDATIDYDYWSPKKNVGIKYSLTTPIDRIQSVEGELQGAYLYNSLKNFEVSHQTSLALNGGSPYSSSYLLSVLENEAKYNYKFVSEGKPIVSLNAEGKYDRRHLRATLNSDVRGAVSNLNLDVEHQLPNIAVTLNGETAMIQGVNNFELKVSNKKNADGTHDSEILAVTDGEDRLRITNKFEYTAQRKSIDVLVAAGDEPVRKLFLLFNKAEQDKWNVEALAKWGEGGKYISTKGSLTKQDGAFDGELSLDSPHLQANKFSVKVSKKRVDGQNGVDISIDGNNKRQLAIGLTYAVKTESNYERSLDGSLKIEGQFVSRPVDFSGKFRLEDTTLDRKRDNGEEGRRLRASVEINTNNSPMKVSALAKRSNKENRLQLSLCKEGDSNCNIGDVHLRHTHAEDGSLDYELRITAESVQAGNKETNGVVLQTKLDGQSKQFEHIVKLIINSEKAEQIGYRLYRNPADKEAGAEILLPARVIALVATAQRPSNGGYGAEISFYIDKTKNADRKISLLLNASEKTKSSDNASGREVEVILRHPDISKDFKIKSRYAYGGDLTILELETVLDVLQAGSEIKTSYSVSKQAVREGGAYNSVLSVISQGLHINIVAKSELKFAGRELSYQEVVTYENREGQIKTAQMLLGVSAQRFNFEVDGPDTKLVSFISAYEAHPTGCEIRYEIHLPGMEDTRIVRAIANTVSPRNVQLKTFTTSDPMDKYYEAFLGFKSDNELVAGLYDQTSDTRLVLGDVSLALNGSRILSIKSDWDKENVNAVLEKTKERGVKQGGKLRELLTNAVEEFVQEARHVSGNIRKATPDLSPATTSAKEQLKELNAELDQHSDTKMIKDSVKLASVYLKQLSRFVFEVVRTAKRILLSQFAGVRESLNEFQEKYSETLKQIPAYIDKLPEIFSRGVDAFINAYQFSVNAVSNIVKRLSESLPPFPDMWNWIVDHTECMGQVLSQVVESVSKKLAVVYSHLRTAVDKVLANRTVQAFVGGIMSKLQDLLAEFVEDTKEQFEAFKDYMLNLFPQKEFQEFVEAVIDYIRLKASKTGDVDDALALRTILQKLKATISRTASDIFTLDFQKGIFRARIPLPVSLKSLSEFSKVFSVPSRPKITFRIPSYTYGLRELINQIRSGAAINELFPPFKGYGLLIGSKHYKTFDGRFYEFEGICQYLLASDFEDGNFTVVVDYDKQGEVSQKSIIVTDGQDTVALKPDHSVVVNGQTVAIDNPKEAGTFLIERMGDWVVVRGKKGYAVGCSASEDVCAVKVDGFYHGKVGGLLGKMNLERFDDLSKPNGEVTYSVEEFVSSWKLNKQCNEPRVFTTMLHSTASAQEKCGSVLDSRHSSLRPCYGVVDPTPFRNVCEKLAIRPGYTEEKAVCTAAVGYAKACFFAYAKVDHVPACNA